jgi:hypothetical protein
MNWEGCEKKRLQHNLRYYPGVYLEGLAKTTENVTQSPDGDLTQPTPGYKSKSVTASANLLVKTTWSCISYSYIYTGL